MDPTGMHTGTFERIYDPSDRPERPSRSGQESTWYFNDHTFVQDHKTGSWHLYGITHPEPASPLDETRFGHATAETLTQRRWDHRPAALTATGTETGPSEGGEHHIWAPDVTFHDGTYYMFYAGGVVDEPRPHERYKLQLATSTDLSTWQRHPQNPLFEDGYDARDPCLIRYDGRWVLFYTATVPRSGGSHVVAYRTSTDLVHWGDKRIAFGHPATGTTGGPTESPTVIEHGDHWYLFVCCDPEYTSTRVYRSDTPLAFEYENDVGAIETHAAEVVHDDGTWYISGAGWEQGGVFLASLSFPTT